MSLIVQYQVVLKDFLIKHPLHQNLLQKIKSTF